ncbi:MAG TPA: hypothetical protein VK202_06485 [Bacteroidia bacterium]|nr:hypothetical protein [Bacteroidia bacterium]
MNTIPSHEALLKATDLIKKISEGLSSAHFSLNLIERDLLRKQCLELYEQLLVLDVQPESLLEQAVVKEKQPEPVLPVADVHVEEPEEKEISIPQVPDVTPSSLSFDFTEEVEEVKEEELVDTPANNSEKTIETSLFSNTPVETETPEPVQESHTIEEVVEQEELRLNEKISKAGDKKLFMDKMMFTPIDNIKSHITLNKKVAFIIGLFNQEGDDYNKAIDQLNTADNLQAALDIYHMLKTRYAWNAEQDLVKELEVLVRRRYSAGL